MGTADLARQLLPPARQPVGNVHYQSWPWLRELGICFGKMKSGALPNQSITLASGPSEARPVKERDLTTAARNQSRAFQDPQVLRDCRERHPMRLRQICHATITQREVFQDAPPGRVGQGGKRAVQRSR